MHYLLYKTGISAVKSIILGNFGPLLWQVKHNTAKDSQGIWLQGILAAQTNALSSHNSSAQLSFSPCLFLTITKRKQAKRDRAMSRVVARTQSLPTKPYQKKDITCMIVLLVVVVTRGVVVQQHEESAAERRVENHYHFY